MENPLEFLGLKYNATPEEIKNAYRLYARKFHPDKHGNDPFFDEYFKKVQIAYELAINSISNNHKQSKSNDPEKEYAELLSENRELKATIRSLKSKIKQQEEDVRWSYRRVDDIYNQEKEYTDIIDELKTSLVKERNNNSWLRKRIESYKLQLEIKQTKEINQSKSQNDGCAYLLVAIIGITLIVIWSYIIFG